MFENHKQIRETISCRNGSDPQTGADTENKRKAGSCEGRFPEERSRMAESVSKDISQVERRVQALCEGCADITVRPMKIGAVHPVDCLVVYNETAVGNMLLEDSVIGKMLNHFWKMEPEQIIETVRQDGLGISDVKELQSMEEAIQAVLAGNAVFFLNGYGHALKIGGKGYPDMGVPQAESEKGLRGSREAFGESVKMNTALVRKRLRSTQMKVEEQVVGEASHTMLNLVYMEGLVYPELLEEIRSRLQNISPDGVMDSGVIEQLMQDVWYSPFPQFQTTERPDKAASALLDGRILLLCDNTPVGLLLPTTMNSLMQTGDDYYGNFEIASLLRCIRYLAIFLAFSFPGLYLAVTGFHPQILPVNLILSMAESRRGVPFAALAEVLFLEISFELMREAGLRMPGPIGNMIGIVGGLIIGQAAVTANLISPMIVIVDALTALGSFSIPNEELSEAFRILKYGMIVLCGFFGIYGFVAGWLALLIHLAGLRSFGIPYLMPFAAGERDGISEWSDGIFRAPMRRMNRRPVYARREVRNRNK